MTVAPCIGLLLTVPVPPYLTLDDDQRRLRWKELSSYFSNKFFLHTGLLIFVHGAV